jgi:hypothetical protein
MRAMLSQESPCGRGNDGKLSKELDRLKKATSAFMSTWDPRGNNVEVIAYNALRMVVYWLCYSKSPEDERRLNLKTTLDKARKIRDGFDSNVQDAWRQGYQQIMCRIDKIMVVWEEIPFTVQDDKELHPVLTVEGIETFLGQRT